MLDWNAYHLRTILDLSLRLLTAITLSQPVAVASAATTPVFVQAAEQGQGILRERNGECFVVTPDHVVRDSAEILVTAQGRLEAVARLETTFSDDLAVLRVVDRGRFGCGPAWDEARGLSELLAASVDGVLVTMSQAGAVQRRFVRVVGYNHTSVRIRPISEADGFFKTLSGGLLEIGGRPSAVLLQVDATNGVGTALRMDHLSDVVRSFFDVRPVSAEAAVSAYTVRSFSFRALVTSRTKIFEQPDRMAPTLGSFDVGMTFEVTGQVNERLWYRIRHNDTVGFIPTTAAKRL